MLEFWPIVVLALSHAVTPADLPLAGYVIGLDPGHPSETSAGTKGPGGSTEVHVNWVVARRLAIELQRRGAVVVMTKTAEDSLVTNRRRAERANEAEVDLLLRLHCDAGTASGYRCFHPDRQGSCDGTTGPAPSVIESSKRAAVLFHRGMSAVLETHLPSLGVAGDSATFVGQRQGALTGSIFSRVPVVTIEMCVLTNRADEGFIVSPRGQRRMVEALVAGTIAAVEHRHPSTRQTKQPPSSSTTTSQPSWLSTSTSRDENR